MYFMLLMGFFIGIGVTMLVQDITAKVKAYQERKQAEFEAAVAAAAAHRKAQADRAWHAVLQSVDDPFA